MKAASRSARTAAGWRASISAGRTASDAYKAVYGKTRREVAGKLTKVLREVQQGAALPDERQTVAQFLERWLEHKRGEPPVARMAHVRAGRAAAPSARDRQGAARATDASAGRSLVPEAPGGWRECAQHPVREDGVPGRAESGAQVAHGDRQRRSARRSAATRRPRDSAAHAGAGAPLLTVADGHRLGAIVSVATALGLRLGEALGLRWSDIDFEAGTLSVRQALERSGGDSAARRPLAIERRGILKQHRAAAPRSAERREARAELEKLRIALAEDSYDAADDRTEVRAQPTHDHGCRRLSSRR